MTDQCPIVPSPELREQWYASADGNSEDVIEAVANQAARWGADQELEACCTWLNGNDPYEQSYPRMLRAARRPKPLSMKEQALKALQFVDEKLDLPLHNHCNVIHTIRTALEALPND